MELITSHTNADFDTLGSMVAAKKLYPNAVVAFSGSLEKTLKIAVEKIKLPFKIEPTKNIKLEKITRLILVDVSDSKRLGGFTSVINNKNLEIHIYDHHTDNASQTNASLEVIEKCGSTTTILTLIIKAKKIKITPIEATIMMAGIYEDTGSLSFQSTTTKDYEAASYLLEKGADLKTTSELIKHSLTPTEVSALSRLIENETTYLIEGIEVVIATVILENFLGQKKYRGEISNLAQHLVEIDPVPHLFLLADMGGRIHIVGRSSTSRINVGVILTSLGGGGHSTAASATLTNSTLIEAKERLIKALQKNIIPKKTVSSIMTTPAITISGDETINAAAKLMRNYNLNALPIMKNNFPVGILTRQVASKARHHDLGTEKIENFMSTEPELVTPRTSIETTREKVISGEQRILPVMERKKIIGVVTRTDLLKLLHEELKISNSKKSHLTKEKNLSSQMRERLPVWVQDLLKNAGEVALREGFKAYVVGGFVRDLVLRRDNLDIDIVIEGDGIDFAKKFAASLKTKSLDFKKIRVRTHERFKTAVIIFPDGFKIDIATARLEYYEKPGALPTVELSSLKLDLFRRDFTINTLALSINPKSFGKLIDYFGALGDLKSKTIRVLHNLSFIEDPTRALRAVRFSVRFDFIIGKHTLNLIKKTLPLKLAGKAQVTRVRDELINILKEKTCENIFTKLSELNLLRLINEKICWNNKIAKLFSEVDSTLSWYALLYKPWKINTWLVKFLALTDGLREHDLMFVIEKLVLPGRKKRTAITVRDKGLQTLSVLKNNKTLNGSKTFALLNDLPLELIIYIMAKTKLKTTKKIISEYVSELKGMEIILTGADLKKLGIKEGPVIGEILNLLHEKKLDKKIESKSEELEFVRMHYLKVSKK
ncbi:MAG: CBS domain-containing protein [Deltaproteobacteria bacterium]|nr:CBS domain-containing protein [Deltaproteobacteria bacterium]